jgi:hypothetical protein
MKLYDVEQSAQKDLVNSGQDHGSQEEQIDLVKRFTTNKTFASLKYD